MTLGSRGFLACFGVCPPAACPGDPLPGTPAAAPCGGVLRSSFWLEDRVGCSCQRPTTAPPLPLARLLALPCSSSSSEGAGT